MEGSNSHDKDLPLMANSDKFHLYHYIMDLHCNLTEHVISGQIYLFLNPVRNCSQNRRVFSMQEYLKQMISMCELDTSSNHSIPLEGHCGNSPENFDKLSQSSRCASTENDTLEPATKLSKLEKIQNTCTQVASVSKEIHSSQLSCDLPVEKNATDVHFTRSDPVQLILDAYQLEVNEVTEVLVPLEQLISLAKTIITGKKSLGDVATDYLKCCQYQERTLEYSVEKWCIKIWKDGVTDYALFPRLVKIDYCTLPDCASLRWTLDQDERPCVFTSAMWVNNRALFPTAEYGNLSTWQCSIKTSGGVCVLMSSDQHGIQRHNEDYTVHYHQCGVPLPPFTLAIAVGHWRSIEICETSSRETATSGRSVSCHPHTCLHSPACQLDFCHQESLPCRLYGAESVLEGAQGVLSAYWPRCTRVIQEQLGASPFSRADLLIYPSCVQDMALSNPYLIFLSQSLLAEDGSMMMRVAHEVSHAWFGLLIGAKDWTEEWLSEGFATYMEDPIHALAMGMNEKGEVERGELRALIRHKVLEAEIGHTDTHLQTLRPDPSHSYQDNESPVMYVKDGMNPNKQFTQVHYLKGYFLLRHLAGIVGVRKFNSALKSYVEKFHGQLVLSKEFLQLVFDSLPQLGEHNLSVESIYSDWLDVPGIPEGIKEFKPKPGNSLFLQVQRELAKWTDCDKRNQRKHTRRASRKRQSLEVEKLEPDQLVLMLEEILLLPKLKFATLKKLKETYNLQQQNADVRHRWCELVVKHKYVAGYPDVDYFLINDQAMGVYLYGELVLSGSPRQRALAEHCFYQVSGQMEEGTRRTVSSMLYAEAS